MATESTKDFFISYTQADRAWAEWAAWQLEEAGYEVIIQAWDFKPGVNFLERMDTALKQTGRTLLILTPEALDSRYVRDEWTAALKQERLVPVRVRECDPEGLLGTRVYIDLVGFEEAAARERLLARLQQDRGKPETPPAFPGDAPAFDRSVSEQPSFPGAPPRYKYTRGTERRLRQKHDEFQAVWEEIGEKLSRLKKQHISETREEEKYRLEGLIKATESQRNEVASELKNLEEQLNHPRKGIDGLVGRNDERGLPHDIREETEEVDSIEEGGSEQRKSVSLGTKERNDLIDKTAALPTFQTGGASGVQVLVEVRADLSSIVPLSFNYNQPAGIVAGLLIARLEKYGWLQDRPAYHALGVFLATILDIKELNSRDDEQFVAGLIVKHSLVTDDEYLKGLRRSYDV